MDYLIKRASNEELLCFLYCYKLEQVVEQTVGYFRRLNAHVTSTETKTSSFWRNFRRWLHLQPVTEISTKWQHFPQMKQCHHHWGWYYYENSISWYHLVISSCCRGFPSCTCMQPTAIRDRTLQSLTHTPQLLGSDPYGWEYTLIYQNEGHHQKMYLFPRYVRVIL